MIASCQLKKSNNTEIKSNDLRITGKNYIKKHAGDTNTGNIRHSL